MRYKTFSLFNYFTNNSRHVSILKKSNVSSGAIVYTLHNDRQAQEEQHCYISRSLDQFKSILQNNTFYIYVSKAFISKKNKTLKAGHIASFLTDAHTQIISDSCVSLREGTIVYDELLVYKLNHLSDDKQREYRPHSIQFLTIEEELQNHFLRKAQSTELKDKDFLISIPSDLLIMTEDEILINVKKMKGKFKYDKFLLCDGTIGNQKVNALNCVKGFYESLLLTGKETNPSPQMACWSFLKLVMDEGERDKLISNTGLRIISSDLDTSLEMPERTNDDTLQFKKD